MADQASRRSTAADSGRHAASGGAVGLIVFAVLIMILAGTFQFIAGLVALFENEFYVTSRNNVFQLDATTWGWIHLLLGIIVGVAGAALLAGRTWARVVAITVAALSALANFVFLPYHPVWALTIITLDVLVIWAVAAHGHAIQNASM
jgi:hypothetical protein